MVYLFLFLYRFTHISPQKFKSLPLRLVQSPLQNDDYKETQKSAKDKKRFLPEFQKENIPECHFVEKKMSLTELGLIWKTAAVARYFGTTLHFFLFMY